MASLDFPTNPTNGQTYTQNGVSYYYNAAIGAWLTQITSTELAATAANNQVLFIDGGFSNGTSGLVYSKTANTMYANGVVANAVVATTLHVSTLSGTGLNPTNNSISAAFDRANNSLQNTSFTLNGDLTVSGTVNTNININATRLRSNIIQSSTGTDFMIDGYPRMPGQIIQHLTAPCNGRTVGPYTWPNVTAVLPLTTTYQDVTGSVLSYTPPAGTNTVLYRFSWLIKFVSYSGISHYRFYIDSDEVIGAYRCIAANYESSAHANFNQIFEWSIQCNAATTTASKGEFTSWTSPKTLKIQAREYDGSTYQQVLHQNDWRDGAGASAPYTLAVPMLTIIAIA